MKTRQIFNRRRKRLLMKARHLRPMCQKHHQKTISGVSTSAVPVPRRKAIIFRSELAFICKHILEYPDIETGGELFGYWTSEGVPVILYAIGAGPMANHQVAFFNQDKEFLLSEGTMLKERFGLQHIGEWHSHHKLGLAHPSRHDADTMISTIREMNLGRFLLCIGNCTDTTSSLKCFMCDRKGYEQWDWELISQTSPVRNCGL